MTFLFSYFFKCVNRSFFGISAMYFFLSFSKNAMESLEKPCPFQVEVLVIRIQLCPSGYFRMRADVPDSFASQYCGDSQEGREYLEKKRIIA